MVAHLKSLEKTIRNHRVKLHRLYEQYLRARKGAPRAQIEAAITTYIARWKGWVTGGLRGTFQFGLEDAAHFDKKNMPKFLYAALGNCSGSVAVFSFN